MQDEIIQKLILLRDKISQADLRKKELEQKEIVLDNAHSLEPIAIKTFDEENKERYIKYRIGPAPVKPNKVMKLAYPLYLSKKKEYEIEYQKYKAKYAQIEKEYYEEFAAKRDRLEAEETARIVNETQIAQKEYDAAKEKYIFAVNSLNEDTTISKKLKKIDIVDELINFFHEQRADSLKEAINLYYEEEHRRKLEELAEEQLALTSEAVESAKQAMLSAEEAINMAEQALERADAAYEKAEDAYNEAVSSRSFEDY